ncbi:BREX-1 system adenine-specific DNA-methyltransferase PglX [Paenibacillus sp. MER 78]|uniref:BREX-1 system adenine-specific DNA-methyltransferase PglX n=1 Tax=Paenibacillus sp. MER 78 TaxID=2939571 RepID=UPI00203F8A0F|nr:BREX-1 system adenine-specific DNA-methyltransferase PglX [Paenibacillus sp. MER 78]MCM3128123.1 BREX-1 system adenine-specific DNA-methyltransferase PglX [Paenibacillus sp. MER 78]
MNKTALKNFATNARKELIEKVKAKAFRIGITEESIKKAQFESSDAIYIDGKQLSATEKKQREKLIFRIKEIGYQQVVEEISYTWFNRFTALRFMEVNNYLPTKVRVLSSSNADSSEPDIIKEALTVELDVDKELVYDLKINNKTEELFKYLVIKQCNSLNKILPFMFETIDDYKEILFPDGVLAKDSFLWEMTDVTVIPESDWKQVEIVGWLYQFYIADEKDRVFKAKNKYKSEEIPFATQLFTPDWIVKYMVQNSLGRYWIESHPENRNLIENWNFYLETLDREYESKGNMTHYINNELRVEEMKCFDPAMGSGHILVYMFDVLYEIYSMSGYMEREIPRLIIENNLFGLDIDDRAYQLACFSIVMKAMQYYPRFFRSIEKEGLKLNLASIQETNSFKEQDVAYIAGEGQGENFDKTVDLIEQFKNAKTFGSLIKITAYDREFLEERLVQIRTNPVNDIFMEESRVKAEYLLPLLLKQAEIMFKVYDVVVTNPPYMGSRYMNEDLSTFLKREYPNSKSDTFASFMEIDHYLKPNSMLSMINQHSWMFLSSFENLRKKVINNKTIYSMLHLGTRAFEEIGGEVVQTTAFVLRNSLDENFKGQYVRLVEFQDSKEKMLKTIEAVENPSVNYRFTANINGFNKIPGDPIAYWVSAKVKDIFHRNSRLRDLAEPKQGLATADNNRFLRQWNEISFDRITFNMANIEEALSVKGKWFPYNKGGEFRKWFGNNYFVVNWENDGYEIKGFKDENGKVRSRPQNTNFYFKEGVTWSDISTSNFGVRYTNQGYIFDVSGSMAFPSKENLYYISAFLCSKIAYEFLLILNPTMHFQTGNIADLPIILPEDPELRARINKISQLNIEIAKSDWDSYEMSWDFKMHPLLRGSYTSIEDSFNEWNHICQKQLLQMKSNEEELNRMFIDIYGLQDEMLPFVDDTEVTLGSADREKDVISFISYAVGCMFGRYSLDEEGLIFTGNNFNPERYRKFSVDKDNILPILTGAYFEDDMVSRLVEFIKVTFGSESLKENLEFIATSLGHKEGSTSQETIRKYLLNQFIKDHIQTYRKKPIYWLLTSGKQKAFNCLIYMHSYDKSTLSRIRTDYLHELQIRMDAEKKTLLDIINGDGTAKEIANAKKELKSLELKIEELRAYDEKLHHMADMQIEIDLDDGVAVNYAKFDGLLAPIK